MTAQTSYYRPRDPRLSTITMVERTIKENDELLSRTQLWNALPRKIMYPTFKEIMDYLEASNKIMYDKNGKIAWIAADNPKLKKFFSSSVRLR
jgi:hypothetical protein